MMNSMDFSKKAITSHHFSKKTFGGLNEFEVQDYLNVLAEEMYRLRQLSLDQEAQIKEQKEIIAESRDREHILKESITIVQKITEKIRKDAETQSEMILQTARDKKERIIRETRESLQGIYNDIAGLKRLYIQFKTSLTASVRSHLELLEQESFLSSSLLESSAPLSAEEAGEETSSLAVEGEQGASSEPDLNQEESEEVQKASPPPKEEMDSLAKSLKSLSEEFL